MEQKIRITDGSGDTVLTVIDEKITDVQGIYEVSVDTLVEDFFVEITKTRLAMWQDDAGENHHMTVYDPSVKEVVILQPQVGG